MWSTGTAGFTLQNTLGLQSVGNFSILLGSSSDCGPLSVILKTKWCWCSSVNVTCLWMFSLSLCLSLALHLFCFKFHLFFSWFTPDFYPKKEKREETCVLSDTNLTLDSAQRGDNAMKVSAVNQQCIFSEWNGKQPQELADDGRLASNTRGIHKWPKI